MGNLSQSSNSPQLMAEAEDSNSLSSNSDKSSQVQPKQKSCPCISGYKEILLWKNPVRTSSILFAILVVGLLNINDPILKCLAKAPLVLIVVCALTKIVSFKVDKAHDFLAPFLEYKGSNADKLVEKWLQLQRILIYQIMEIISIKNPLKSAIVSFALYMFLQFLETKVLMIIFLGSLISSFSIYPVSQRLGFDVEPFLYQIKELLCSSVSSLSKNISAAAGRKDE